jgi:hypothetical protein
LSFGQVYYDHARAHKRAISPDVLRWLQTDDDLPAGFVAATFRK